MDILIDMARGTEIDDLQVRAFGSNEEDVLRLEIAMHDADIRTGKKDQGGTELARKLEGEVQGNTTEVSVGKQLVEVVGKALKHQTPMALVGEVALQVN